MSIRKCYTLIFVAVLVLACLAFTGCGSRPSENDAKARILEEYDCDGEPELLDAYETGEDGYCFQYKVRYLTTDDFQIIEVTAYVDYWKTDGKWQFAGISEGYDDKVSLNADALLGTWTGYCYTHGTIMSNDNRMDIVLKIKDVEGMTMSYDLTVDGPYESYVTPYYDDSGEIHMTADASKEDLVISKSDEPLITVEVDYFMGRDRDYIPSIYSYKGKSEYSGKMSRGFFILGGGYNTGYDIELTKESETVDSSGLSKSQSDSDSLRVCDVISARASSNLDPYEELTYVPSNVYDGNPATAWVEGVSGQGIGEWIEVECDNEMPLKGIYIKNGYQKTKDIFYRNTRINQLLAVFPDGSEETLFLEDRMGEQYLAFSEPHYCSTVKLVIESVFEGTKYEDASISEILLAE